MHRFVVLAERARGFDTLEQARVFALANVPAVICERSPGGTGELREIARHDWLYDRARDEWRIMLADTGLEPALP